MKLAAVLLVLTFLTRHHTVLLPLAVLAAAGVAVWFAVWSYRAEPQVWVPPRLWSGRFA